MPLTVNGIVRAPKQPTNGWQQEFWTNGYRKLSKASSACRSLMHPSPKKPAEDFLQSIKHENTRERYASSVLNLRAHFANTHLSGITSEKNRYL